MLNGLSFEAFKEMYEKIKRNYPDTLAWIKHKAKWEHMTLVGVVNNYHQHIERLMKQEDSER